MPYLIVFLAALAAAFILTPLMRRLSMRWGIVAEPGGRRKHVRAIPKLGGLAVFGAWAAGVFLVYWLLPPLEPDDALRLRGVILGSLLLTTGGLLDDWRDLKPWAQFLIQFMGAAIAISHLIFIEVFTNPLAASSFWHAPPFSWLLTIDGDLIWIWRPLALLFTVFWVVGMINAINWLDGLDGLAAGVCTIAALLFAWHSYRLGQTTVALFPLALAGALLGFLPFNFAPARIFLGTAGAYFLGYQVATLSILSPAKLSTALLVLAVPILDVAWQIINRLRRGQNPLQGDRGHLHFRLSDGGLPTRHIVVGYYIVAIAFGLVAILAPSGLFKLILWLALGTVVFALLIWLSRRPIKK
ncbi:MAG: undecaprenyl/decaprenyl-phosphate alpha-N-acetylglucosaminyl 1-phosphate transferase [Chloroflexi bacterium]|jgi:UDP-GlcNAc:undecaprenyl-phosphate GlcNAc-1-phosphate transferase|nr:undecaprenyl/decaprenyl-phosphate alpha-N-acetylglucosaminyl 1-phosphate transferase [Chloroflexota bacterium]